MDDASNTERLAYLPEPECVHAEGPYNMEKLRL